MISKERVSAQESTLDILVFTIGEVYCGIDGELIGRMLTLAEADAAKVQVSWFHQGLSFGAREVAYLHPKVVTFRGDGEETGLVIDQPRDLLPVPIRMICPMPYLFGVTKGLRAFWGSFLLDEKIVLLVEPYLVGR
ncbi:MAG: hypothetical protein HGA96_14845 [Desulfobulbaceae bacterium]|nr:hypothetical protein [Desulfobulbaceae bacterium]